MSNRIGRNVALVGGTALASAIIVFAGANPAAAPVVEEIPAAAVSAVPAMEIAAFSLEIDPVDAVIPAAEPVATMGPNVSDISAPEATSYSIELADFSTDLAESVAVPSVLELAKVALEEATKPVSAPTGDQITAIGDSLMVGATPHLEELLPGISIDGRVGRPLPEGMSILDELAAQGAVRDFVVLGLATNAGVVVEQFDEIVSEIGSDRVLVLVNAWGDRSWIPGGNEQVAAAAAKYPGQIVIADWYSLIAEHPEYIGPDGIHANEAGKVAYAQLVTDALTEAAQLR